MADEYREKLSLDVENFVGGLHTASTALGTFAGLIAQDVMNAIGGMISGLISMAKETGKAAESLENLGAATAMSERNLTTMQSLAQVAGGSVDSLGMSVRIMAQQMQQADQGNVQMQEKLKLLGITTRDPYQAMLQLSDTLARYKDDANKVALVSEVMGRGFANILPSIKAGSAAFKEAEDRAIYMGTSFDYVRDTNIKNMDDAFDKLAQAGQGFWKNLVGAVSPAIEAVANGLTELTVILGEFMGGLSFPDLLMAQWIRFSALLKEIGVNAMGILGGEIFTESGRAAMRAQIDAIEAEARARLTELKGKARTDDPNADTRPSIGTPSDSQDAANILEADLKLQNAQIEADRKQEKARLDLKKEFLKQQVQAREMSELEAAQRLERLINEEAQLDVDTNLRKMRAVEAFYAKRLDLGGMNKEQQITFETQIKEALVKLAAEQVIAEQKADTARLKASQDRRNAEEKAEKETGERILANGTNFFQVSESQRRKELQSHVDFWRTLAEIGEQHFDSFEDVSFRREQQYRAEMAQALNDTQLTYDQIAAIRMKYEALIDREQRRQRNGFVEGWREALQRYVNDTTSMFGMAVDMARQAAQAMQSAFQRFFFDLFEGRINSLKDVLKGFLDFVKQVMSQVAAEIATAMALKGLGSVLGTGGEAAYTQSFAASGTGFAQGGWVEPKRFAFGGPVLSNGDSVPAMLTPGEFVMSRLGVEALERLNQGITPEEKPISVHIHNAPAGTTAKVDARRTLKETVIGIVLENIAANGDLRQVLRSGV